MNLPAVEAAPSSCWGPDGKSMRNRMSSDSRARRASKSRTAKASTKARPPCRPSIYTTTSSGLPEEAWTPDLPETFPQLCADRGLESVNPDRMGSMGGQSRQGVASPGQIGLVTELTEDLGGPLQRVAGSLGLAPGRLHPSADHEGAGYAGPVLAQLRKDECPLDPLGGLFLPARRKVEGSHGRIQFRPAHEACPGLVVG